METISFVVQQEIIVLFKKNNTVTEIAEQTEYSKQDVLEFLTKEGYYSENCSGCVVKRCYECPGLSELGRPISIQDQINLIAKLRNEKKRT